MSFFRFQSQDKDVKKFARENVKIKFFPFSDYKKYMPGAYSEILGLATYSREKNGLASCHFTALSGAGDLSGESSDDILWFCAVARTGPISKNIGGKNQSPL